MKFFRYVNIIDVLMSIGMLTMVISGLLLLYGLEARQPELDDRSPSLLHEKVKAHESGVEAAIMMMMMNSSS
jgi:hypothetical protein